MLHPIPDSIPDSILFYLRADERPIRPDSLQTDFGHFEYLPTDDHQVLFAADSTLTGTISTFVPGNEGTPLPFSPVVNSALSLLFLLCFVTFSLIFRKEGAAFTGNFSRIFSLRRHPVSTYKEQVTTTEVWGELFMILQALLIFTILIFTFLWDTEHSLLSLKWHSIRFVGIFLSLALFATLKFLMYRTIATFFLENDIKNWTTWYFQWVELLGLVLFFPAVVYVFLPEYRNITLILVFVVFIISQLVLVVELLNIFVKNKIGGFYFFVYLCGTEIAPYLLFYKGVLSLVNIAGNNIV